METNPINITYNVDFKGVELQNEKSKKTSSGSFWLKLFNGIQNLKKPPAILDHSDIIALIPNREEMLWIHKEMEIETKEGKVPMHYFYDGFSRKLVGFSLATKDGMTGLSDALTMALGYRKTDRKLIINHSRKKLSSFSKDYIRLFPMNNLMINFTNID